MFNIPMNLILPATVMLWNDYRLGNNHRIVFITFHKKILTSIRNSFEVKKTEACGNAIMVYICLLFKNQIGANRMLEF